MFFEESFALVPGSTARSVEEMLVKKFDEEVVLSLVLFEPSQGVQSFMDDPGVNPGWREAAKVGTFSTFVYAVFLELFFHKKNLPTRIYFLEDLLHF